VIEESLRRDLKLDVLDELWSNATLSESKASELALEAQHVTRPRRRASGARRRDVNVLISATLSARGSSAEVIRSFRDGAFELVLSELPIAELTRALAYPKIRKRIPSEKAHAFVSWVRSHGTLAEDPRDPPSVCSPDPDDDNLVALAIGARSYLVTGEQHLLGLQADLPILTPAEFLTKLRQSG
jgi:uncharacterized protein